MLRERLENLQDIPDSQWITFNYILYFSVQVRCKFYVVNAIANVFKVLRLLLVFLLANKIQL